jgi:hypothetical protein
MPSFVRPSDLDQLRFDQLRSKNMVLAPWNTAQAAQQNLERAPRPAMLLPAAMGHNKWKTPPRGYDRGYGAAARSVGVLAQQYATPAPLNLMQPVPFYTQNQAAAPIHRMPRQDVILNTPDPLSRGLLQRGGLDITNAAELRAVAAFRNDPPSAYGVQENIAAQMFPSNYVFNQYDRPKFYTYPERGTLNGVPGAPQIIAPMYGVGRQPLIVYSERTQAPTRLGGAEEAKDTALGMVKTVAAVAWWGSAAYWIYMAGFKNRPVNWPVKAYTIGVPLYNVAMALST